MAKAAATHTSGGCWSCRSLTRTRDLSVIPHRSQGPGRREVPPRLLLSSLRELERYGANLGCVRGVRPGGWVPAMGGSFGIGACDRAEGSSFGSWPEEGRPGHHISRTPGLTPHRIPHTPQSKVHAPPQGCRFALRIPRDVRLIAVASLLGSSTNTTGVSWWMVEAGLLSPPISPSSRLLQDPLCSPGHCASQGPFRLIHARRGSPTRRLNRGRSLGLPLRRIHIAICCISAPRRGRSRQLEVLGVA